MIQENPQNGLESALALSMSMEGNCNKDLTERASEQNISDNLVVVAGFDEIKDSDRNSIIMTSKGVGTGLMITTDGFIITAYHNVEEYIKDWNRINKENPPTPENIDYWMEEMKMRYAVVDQQGKAYPIDTTFLLASRGFDIAIIKAVIKKKPEPIDFKIFIDDLKVNYEIKLLGLKDQKQYNQYGKILSESYDASVNNSQTGNVSTKHDTFFTDAYGVPGFSGGVFTTLDGKFAGLSLYSSVLENKNIGHIGGAKIKNIVSLVREAAYSIYKQNK